MLLKVWLCSALSPSKCSLRSIVNLYGSGWYYASSSVLGRNALAMVTGILDCCPPAPQLLRGRSCELGNPFFPSMALVVDLREARILSSS